MNTKTLLACTAVVIAFALVLAPLAIAEDASAKKSVKQIIKQSQKSSQKSQVVGKNNFFSGNNINLQGQANFGGNFAAQSD